jgi:HEAT repeat protein
VKRVLPWALALLLGWGVVALLAPQPELPTPLRHEGSGGLLLAQASPLRIAPPAVAIPMRPTPAGAGARRQSNLSAADQAPGRRPASAPADPQRSNHVAALIAALSDPRPAVRARAAASLGQLRAHAAGPALVHALRTGEPKAAFAWALGRLGAAMLPELGDLLRSPDSRLRGFAQDALRAIGRAATAEVARAAESSDPAVRVSAFEVLARIGPEAAAAIAVLREGLRDTDPRVRAVAADAMARVAPHEGAPRLRDLLGDHEGAVRYAAARSLGRSGPAGSEHLLRASHSPDPEVRVAATTALGWSTTQSRAIQARLRQTLADPDPEVVRAAAWALSRLR